MDRLSNRPLLDNPIDHELFVPRIVAAEALDRAARNGWNAMVTGPRGSGKTSCLRAWAYANRRNRAQVVPRQQVDRLTLLDAVFVSAHGADDALALLETVLLAVFRAGYGGGTNGTEITVENRYSGFNSRRSSAYLIQTLLDVSNDEHNPLVVLVDDVDPVAGHQLFGVLRDELWTVPVQWIVAVDSSKAPELLRPPADAFFETTVTLPPLTAAEATELLQRRISSPFHLDLSEAFPDGILPRDLIKLAQHEVAAVGDGFRAAVAAHAQRDDAIAQLGAPALALTRSMNDLGPVSPSDERLLTQLRWTRARVSQVMKQLAEAGLVEHTTATSNRPGRPARLYQLVPPEKFLTTQAALR